MTIPFECSACGQRFTSRFITIEDSAGGFISGNLETCPHCGKLAGHAPGIYTFVGKAVASFTAAETGKVAAFSHYVQAAAEGSISQDRAANEIMALGEGLSSLWEWANKNSGGLSLLALITSIFLALPEITSDDADILLEATRKQTAVAEKNVAIQKMIYEELHKKNAVPQIPPPMRRTKAGHRQRTQEPG